jgi:hypothetical protein
VCCRQQKRVEHVQSALVLRAPPQSWQRRLLRPRGAKCFQARSNEVLCDFRLRCPGAPDDDLQCVLGRDLHDAEPHLSASRRKLLSDHREQRPTLRRDQRWLRVSPGPGYGADHPVGGYAPRPGAHAPVLERACGPKGSLDGLLVELGPGRPDVAYRGDVQNPEPDLRRFLPPGSISGTSGEPSWRTRVIAFIQLAKNPESESPRGFFVSGLSQGVSSRPAAEPAFSVSRESDWVPVGTPTVTTARRRTAPELSDSLFDSPLRVNTPVTTAPQSRRFELRAPPGA